MKKYIYNEKNIKYQANSLGMRGIFVLKRKVNQEIEGNN